MPGIVTYFVSLIFLLLEADTLKTVAHHYFSDEISKAAGRAMDEYKIGLYTNAGILGFAAQTDAVINHVKEIGIQSFLRDFFPTKDSFAYYDHSQERCEDEWINIASQQKYGETRRLMAFLLGEMRSIKALPALRAIKANDQEKVEVREVASVAVRRIAGE